ncbi:hypothetical protein NP233_g8649 [Leucocoprinus birnbaumii]|uniref:Uncharacterized protein n=1 Tax=Leucocoprinus birnbaumii TaxID=56174 RepID=A0AAD5VM13_9AGAR|nr:hypothetical protein NP233_g8649 [Leucocoprinus birnbaumii]
MPRSASSEPSSPQIIFNKSNPYYTPHCQTVSFESSSSTSSIFSSSPSSPILSEYSYELGYPEDDTNCPKVMGAKLSTATVQRTWNTLSNKQCSTILTKLAPHIANEFATSGNIQIHLPTTASDQKSKQQAIQPLGLNEVTPLSSTEYYFDFLS